MSRKRGSHDPNKALPLCCEGTMEKVHYFKFFSAKLQCWHVTRTELAFCDNQFWSQVSADLKIQSRKKRSRLRSKSGLTEANDSDVQCRIKILEALAH